MYPGIAMELLYAELMLGKRQASLNRSLRSSQQAIETLIGKPRSASPAFQEPELVDVCDSVCLLPRNLRYQRDPELKPPMGRPF